MTNGWANHVKQWLPVLTMTYFAVFGWIDISQLIRWYLGMVHPVPWGALPSGFWTYAISTVLMFLLPNIALVLAFFPGQRTGRFALTLATVSILLIDFLLWRHDTPFATSIRVGIALWLALMIYVLMSNYSFKPRPLRGSA
jgi:hypothetical protein